MSIAHPWSNEELNRLRQLTGLAEVEFYEQLESTNTLALERLRATSPQCPMLILAHEQTAGRGRSLNRWWSSSGGLTFSLIVDGPPEPMDLPSFGAALPLVIGVAVARALLRLVPENLEIKLKWPNDVYLGSQKVAGLLVESIGRGKPLVIGCGLNINQAMETAPEEIRERATSLYQATGRTYSLPEVAREILREMLSAHQQFCGGGEDWCTEFRQYCLLTDAVVAVRQGREQWVGKCRGIDNAGRLVLETEAGTRRVTAGTVERINA